jgi:cyclic pyranopterin phosphate synthase
MLIYSDLLRHTIAPMLPQVIQPDPTEIYITLTANCNLRCIGCRYGRDFMPGSQLSWPIVRDLLGTAVYPGLAHERAGHEGSV